MGSKALAAAEAAQQRNRLDSMWGGVAPQPQGRLGGLHAVKSLAFFIFYFLARGGCQEKLLWLYGFVVCVSWVPLWADALNFDYPSVSLPKAMWSGPCSTGQWQGPFLFSADSVAAVLQDGAGGPEAAWG